MPDGHDEWEFVNLYDSGYDSGYKKGRSEKIKRSRWRLETDEEEPNPFFKNMVCCNCNRRVGADNLGTDYIYCPYCGSKNA